MPVQVSRAHSSVATAESTRLNVLQASPNPDESTFPPTDMEVDNPVFLGEYGRSRNMFHFYQAFPGWNRFPPLRASLPTEPCREKPAFDAADRRVAPGEHHAEDHVARGRSVGTTRLRLRRRPGAGRSEQGAGLAMGSDLWWFDFR